MSIELNDIELWVVLSLLSICWVGLNQIIEKIKEQEKNAIYEQAKEIENSGFVGYIGAIELLMDYKEQEALVLLKKWMYENNEQEFKKLVANLEPALMYEQDVALNYSLDDLISYAKLKATSGHAFEIVYTHRSVLKIKYNQLVRKDDYGNLIFDDWHKEVSYFFENVLIKNINYINSIEAFVRPFFYKKCWEAAKMISPNAGENELREIVLRMVDVRVDYFGRHINNENIISVIESDNAGSSIELIDTIEATPFEYEKYCERQLMKNGWQASVTKNGADQGVDIIATKDDFTIAVQCKKYNSPVGNKAVQEAISGREYYKADAAVVVSNAAYTKAAKQLASASNVKLLHHSQLRQLNPVDFAEYF